MNVKLKGLTKEQMGTLMELAELLKRSQRVEEAVQVLSMTAYLEQMEKKLDEVVEAVSTVQRQLERLEQQKQPNTLAQTLKKSVDLRLGQYQGMQERLTQIKTRMVETAKQMIDAVKTKGKQALNGIVKFLGIREQLEALQEDTRDSIARVENDMEKIETFGSSMRQAGRQAANAVRVLAGGEEKEYGEKKISITELAKKPFALEKERLERLLGFTESALEKCSQLSDEVRQEVKEAEKSRTDDTMRIPETVVPFKTAKSR